MLEAQPTIADRDQHGLTWRALNPDDIDPWFVLVERMQRHDNEQERTRRADLDTVTRQSWVDLAADSRVGVDDEGTFRALGRNSYRPGASDTISVYLEGGVDPHWRGRGIGRDLLRWQQERALHNIADLRARDADSARLRARYGAFAEEQMVGRARLLERAGFTATRWFAELRRPLDGPYDVPLLDADTLRVEPYTDAHAERLRIAHNDAFRDHWGSNPHDAESWRTNLLEDAAFRPAQSFVIVDRSAPGEPVVAYVVNTEYEQDWAEQGFTEGYTEMLGVLREWRGRGLARHLLALSAKVFAEAGHPYATLDVDADNPTGAVALYESLGYQPVHRGTYYSVAV